MKRSFIPEGYKPNLDVIGTQVAIKQLKDVFESKLADKLNLIRISAPLFVTVESGLNDNLNGVERPVGFDYGDGNEAQIVQSLAKWKRFALGKYEFEEGVGLYADMNAIRRDEELDNLHSMYVDQWDWELVINKENRNKEFLKSIVLKLYDVFLETQQEINSRYTFLRDKLPEKITFIDSQELADMYPDLNSKQREREAVLKHGAVFLTRIGHVLTSGEKHDNRAPDYDDWQLNGDFLFYNPVLDDVIELSSMGIRVDSDSLISQLKFTGDEERLKLDYHQAIYKSELPFTIGGGIGQSRICMFFLEKAHIGEVQSSLWDKYTMQTFSDNDIVLL